MKKFILVIALLVSSEVGAQLGDDGVYYLTRADKDMLAAMNKNGVNWNDVYIEFIQLLNAYRREKCLDTLTYSQSAYDAAKFQSEYSYSIKKLTHQSNMLGYETFTDRTNKFNCKSNTGGECGLMFSLFNICVHHQTIAEHILWMWQYSPAHNHILLKPDVKNVGLCSTSNGKGGVPFIFLVVY